MKLLTALLLTILLLSNCVSVEPGRVIVTQAHTVTAKSMLNGQSTIVVDNLFNLTLSQEMYESISIDDRCMFTYIRESMLAFEYVTELDCDIPADGFDNPRSTK